MFYHFQTFIYNTIQIIDLTPLKTLCDVYIIMYSLQFPILYVIFVKVIS